MKLLGTKGAWSGSQAVLARFLSYAMVGGGLAIGYLRRLNLISVPVGNRGLQVPKKISFLKGRPPTQSMMVTIGLKPVSA